MADNSYKALALSRELADHLRTRLNGALAVAESFDTDGYPLINVGAGANGGANALIKVRAQDWSLAKDILGLAANIYSPHTIQLVTEADPAAGAGADPLSPAQLLLILGQITQMGTAVEWYQTISGVAPVVAGITLVVAGNNLGLKASFAPDERHALISQQ